MEGFKIMLFCRLASIFVFISIFSIPKLEVTSKRDFLTGVKIGAFEGLVNNLSGFDKRVQVMSLISSTKLTNRIALRSASFSKDIKAGQWIGQFFTELVTVKNGEIKVRPRVNLAMALWAAEVLINHEKN